MCFQQPSNCGDLGQHWAAHRVAAKEIKDALGFLMEYREGSGQTLPPKFSDEKKTGGPSE